MHDSAYRIGELVMRTYSDLSTAKILEVGSLNVNGCLRDAAMPTTHYVGLDLEEGPSVDFVIEPGQPFPVEEDSFDLVMASSVFEHDARFWDTFVRMCRAARAGGHIYVNAPSNGTVHRYPMDCWRFYPDAGLALAEHARSEGLEIDLVESFVGNRHSDVWNDFVAVFRKGPSAEPLNTAFVYYRYPSLNARTWQSRAVYNESDNTEDMALINALRQQCSELSGQSAELEQVRAAFADEQGQRTALSEEVARLSATIAETEQRRGEVDADKAHLIGQVSTLESDLQRRKVEIDQALASFAEEQARRAALVEEVARLSTTVADTEQRRSEMDADREQLLGQVSTLESNLRQRKEEIEQAWAQAEQLTAERDLLRDRVLELQAVQEHLEKRLADTNEWVFGLAGERRSLEDRLAVVQVELDRTKLASNRMEAAVESKEERLRTLVAHNAALNKDVNLLNGQKVVLHQNVEALVGKTTTLHKEVETLVGQKAILHEDIETLAEQKAALHKDVEMLVERLEQRERAASDSAAQIATLTATLESLRSDTLTYHETAAKALEQLETLRAEHKQQARALRTLEHRAAKSERDLTWLRRLYQLLEKANSGWTTLLPARMRQQRVAQVMQRAGHFDADAYLAKYTDVADAGMDPLRHFVLHGMAEGRYLDAQA